jgi:hypothetical protein
MRSRAKTTLFALLAGAVGCAAPTPPDKPTWEDDVYPIVRGNCSHCHGETAAVIKSIVRFDVCDPMAFTSTGLTLPKEEIGFYGGGSTSTWGLALMDIEPPTGAPRMPPPPAATLSNYERTVLKNWSANVIGAKDATQADVCKKKGPNKAPRAKLIGGINWDGGNMTATIETWDPDEDQTMSHVTAGSGSADIYSSGRHQVVIEGASTGDKVVVKVSDGTTVSEVPLN